MGMNIGSSHDADPEVMVDINTTPLVDVLLVLLVMLIITIPIQLHSVNIEMPGASAPAPPKEPQIVTIDVTQAGQFAWNGEVLAGREVLERYRGMQAATRAAIARDVAALSQLEPEFAVGTMTCWPKGTMAMRTSE